MSYANAKSYIVGKLEGTAGTAEALAAADRDVRLRGIEISPDLAVDDEASKYATGDYLEDESVAGVTRIGHNFSMKCAPSATPATVAPKGWKYVRGCGTIVKAYTTTGIALQDSAAADVTTMTLESFNIARGATPVGIKRISSGCMGNAVLSVDGVGGVANWAFNFTGKFSSEADVANATLLAITAPDATVAPAFKNVVATIGDDALCVKNFTLDFGNSISPELCPAEATGVLYDKIDTRAPRLTITILQPTVASYSPFANFIANAVEVISIKWGAFTLIIPRAQILTYTVADEGGSVAYQLTCKLLRNGTADSEIAIDASFELLQGART